MDSAAIEQAGLKYLQPELKRIAAIKDLKTLQTLILTLCYAALDTPEALTEAVSLHCL